MNIRNPSALWLLLLLLPVALIVFRGYAVGKADLRRLTGSWRFSLIENAYLIKTFFTGLLFMLFVVFSILALADIRWGEKLVEDDRAGFDIALVLDVSWSMLANDLKPTRLESTVIELKRFLAADSDSRYAVVVFKGGALPVLPMTADLQALDLMLSAIGPELLTSAGSDMQKGLEAALSSFHDGGRYRAVVLFSDGESLSGNATKAARAAVKEGIPIFTVGVGTAEGSRIILGGGEFVRDRNGDPVVSRLEQDALESISSISGGRYIPLSELSGLRAELLPALKGMERPAEGLRLVRKSRSGMFQLLGVVSLFSILAIRSFRWRDLL